MKIISAIIIVTVLGCNNSQPPNTQQPAENSQPVKENEMSQTSETQDNSQSEPVVPMLALGMAVPTEEMPPILQQRMTATPAVIGLEETRSLDPETRKQVLTVVERAITHYRKEARGYRAHGNPAQQTAEALESFLEAARK